MIREQEANNCGSKLRPSMQMRRRDSLLLRARKKDQGLLLEMAQQALSKYEDCSVLMISTTVANAMTL
jgi:hypothetical protein